MHLVDKEYRASAERDYHEKDNKAGPGCWSDYANSCGGWIVQWVIGTSGSAGG